MNRYRFLQYVLLSMVLVVVVSCEKYRAKKLSGTYDCTVQYHYWDMLNGESDSTFSKQIEITRDKKKVVVLGVPILADSLWEGQECSRGLPSNYFAVRFLKDSVFITQSAGGQGGNSTLVYAGKKKK
jgi:hypothetical protein